MAPSSISISLRIGWTLPGVQDHYIKYERAGDQYVGRVVAGLPIDSEQFAILPPHFRERDEQVTAAIRDCFPDAPSSISRVLEFCLASLVYHADDLKTWLPPKHPVFSSPLFNASLLEQLKPKVVCRTSEIGDSIHVTGIPPHTDDKLRLKRIENKLDSLTEKQELTTARTVEGVNKMLDEKAVGLGTVTYDGLENRLQALLERNGIGRSNPDFLTEQQTTQASTQDQTSTAYCYTYGNAMHAVPKEFTFPECTMQRAWQLYCCGCPGKYGPLMHATSADMPTPNTRKRLSDFHYIMKKLRDKAKSANIWPSAAMEQQQRRALTLEEANCIFVAVWPQVRPEDRERLNQLKWMTIVNAHRKLAKQ